MSLDPSRLLSVPNVPTDEIEIVQEEEYTVDKINTAYLVGMAKDILKQDEQVKVPIIYDPDIEEIQVLQPSDLPPLPSFYKKKVHRLIPHKNFPVLWRSSDSNFLCSGCNKKVGLKGWNEDRRTIYDLHGMIYLLMYNYICNTVGCEHFHKQMNVYTKVKSEDKRNVYMLVLSD
jgi:hypothetical protein